MENLRSKLKSVSQFKEHGRVVLVRVDYNSEVKDGEVLDNTRIKASLPTLEYLTQLGSRMILISHRGRPKGNVEPSLTMAPQAQELARLTSRKFVEATGEELVFPNYPVPHVVFYGGDFHKLKKFLLHSSLNPGDVVFLENIRFYPGEEDMGEKFCHDLAQLADAFVSEAFSVAHHASTSMVLLPKALPSYAGLRVMKEIETLDFVANANQHPFVLMVGGAKISDKVKMLERLLPKSDVVLVGGALANLFLKVAGYEIGRSKVEDEGKAVATNLWRNYKSKIILPKDVVVSPDLDGSGEVKPVGKVGVDDRILDIGPQSILDFSKNIKSAETIVWNGPLGLFEKKQFSHGTISLARLAASRARSRAFVLVGGGETIQALDMTQLSDYIDFISTGGGAMLSYLGGEEMPGLDALVS